MTLNFQLAASNNRGELINLPSMQWEKSPEWKQSGDCFYCGGFGEKSQRRRS